MPAGHAWHAIIRGPVSIRDTAAQADKLRLAKLFVYLPGFGWRGSVHRVSWPRPNVLLRSDRGPRVLGEMLAELGAERSIMTIIYQKLDTYTEIEPEALEATGGNDFWSVPIHGVKL